MMTLTGIRQEADHWVWFDENGKPGAGRFEREAARWGSWVNAEEAARINGEGRLIDMEDVRACIRAFNNALPA